MKKYNIIKFFIEINSVKKKKKKNTYPLTCYYRIGAFVVEHRGAIHVF